MKISIASDHAGFEYKTEIIKYLETKGHEVIDYGTDSNEAVDYPDFIKPAAKSVARGEAEVGIVLGGSGNGEAMAANKVTGIRCAVCWNKESAKLAKEHNNANIISIGQRMVTLDTALDIVATWLDSEFEGKRHIARIEKIEKDY
jgi:ribose 5-phosphate isomerase B